MVDNESLGKEFTYHAVNVWRILRGVRQGRIGILEGTPSLQNTNGLETGKTKGVRTMKKIFAIGNHYITSSWDHPLGLSS